MHQDGAKASIWQRLAAFLTAMDGAFDPNEGERARLRALEARVRALEAGEQNVGSKD